jgi:hypothetical protein
MAKGIKVLSLADLRDFYAKCNREENPEAARLKQQADAKESLPLLEDEVA